MKTAQSSPQLVEVIGRIPPEVLVKLEAAMTGLETSLLTFDPMMKEHLRESHRLLVSYPETVHLLDDSEIAQLLTAAQEHMKVRIVSEAAKGKGGAKKAKPSVDDL